MKHKDFLFIILFSIGMAFADDYVQQPLKAKTEDKNLNFAVTFDQYGTRAELAKGDPDSSLKQVNLSLRGTVGFDLKQGYQPIGEEELFYKATGNISPDEGSVSIWLNNPDYAPSTKTTDGQNRGNTALFEFVAKGKDSSQSYALYEFEDGVNFYIWPSWHHCPVATVGAKRNGIRKGEWYQVVFAWTASKLKIYLNGEKCGEMELRSEHAGKMRNFQMTADSYFGIPRKVWGETRKSRVLFDDIKIYSCALPDLEIKRKFNELLLTREQKPIELFEMTISGVDRTKDKMWAHFDFSALPDNYAVALKNSQLSVEYTLSGPEGFKKNGSFKPSKNNDSFILDGIAGPGLYELQCMLVLNGERSPVHTAKIDKPDLSFLGNHIGMSDQVPSPWPPIEQKGQAIKIWNRVYEFSEGPFPVNITVGDKSILEVPPELKIVLSDGPANIDYKQTQITSSAREAVISGSGTFGEYKIDYVTKVAFDGMIRTDFVIHGNPEINSMTLTWTVADAIREFLLTPFLFRRTRGQYSSEFPSGDSNSILWFSSEKNGGFAYAMEHDANWSYPEGYRVFNANTKTGQCSIEMIAQKTRIPDDTNYHALFIATPTRPRFALKRIVKLTYAYNDDGKRPQFYADGIGLEGGCGSFKPDPILFPRVTDRFRPNSVAIYGMADALAESNPVGQYFKQSYHIPGAYRYTITSRRWNPGKNAFELFTDFSQSACNATSVVEYFLQNQAELFKHPSGNRIWMLYYDLCGNTLCGNPLHGCGFKDKLGRDIKTFQLLNKRSSLLRALQHAHENGRVVLTHAQNRFNPFMHSLADYWQPGEENNGVTASDPYYYTDTIPEKIWRSEYSADTLGPNLIFLLSVNTRSLRLSEAGITPLLLRDIEFCQSFMPVDFPNKVWNCLQNNGVDSDSVFSSFRDQKEVISSNPEVKVSYYRTNTPNKFVFILGNESSEQQSASVDFSKFFTEGTLTDVYSEKSFKLDDGKIQASLPDRSFQILVYNSGDVK